MADQLKKVQQYKQWELVHRNKAILIAVGIVVVIVLLFEVWIDRVKGVQKNVRYQLTVLKDNCERRQNLLDTFASLVQANAPQSQNIAQALVNNKKNALQFGLSETILADKQAVEAFCVAQHNVAKSLQQMKMLAQTTPNLAQNQQYYL